MYLVGGAYRTETELCMYVCMCILTDTNVLRACTIFRYLEWIDLRVELVVRYVDGGHDVSMMYAERVCAV